MEHLEGGLIWAAVFGPMLLAVQVIIKIDDARKRHRIQARTFGRVSDDWLYEHRRDVW